MEKLFKLKENNTTVKTEVMAGITTFLTMAYILAVNPNILSASGMDSGAVFTATALASALATFIMAFWANYPIALSAGMGLNAYFAFTVCLGDLNGIEDPWRIALSAVLVEGIIFIILSFFKLRETIVNAIPANLKYGITAGIGLFIALIGLKGANVVVANESTLIDLGDFSRPDVVLCLIGMLVIVIMNHFKIKGS
ncbi:MAG: NCS2 family permease [Clostridia bacterium]|nr:NCS2 family permease [Clostridia bacterium]